MKRILTFLAVALLASGCTPSAQERFFPVMPKELQDCKVFRLDDGSGTGLGAMNVMRCPNSSTSVTYKSGKTTVQSAVIDF